MIRLIFKIALKFIFYKNKSLLSFVTKSFKLSILALSLSIFSIIILNSVSVGYIESLREELNNYFSDLEIITTSSTTFEKIIDFLKKNNSIYTQQTATISAPGILKYDVFSHGVEVISCISQQCLTKVESNQILLGEDTYEIINKEKKNDVYLLNAQSIFHNFGFNKKISKLNVNPEKFDYFMPQDRYKVLIHSDDFYKLFNESNSNITYSIKCFHDNPSHRDSDLNEKKIYFENLNRSIKVDDFEQYYTIKFEERFENLSKSIKQIFTTISLILYFFIALSITNIISTVWLIIESKKNQIKILTLMGLSRIDMFLLVVFLTTSLVSTSFILGYISSEVISYLQNTFNVITVPKNVYIISNIKILVDRVDAFKLFILFNIIGIVASVLPYYKAKVDKEIHV